MRDQVFFILHLQFDCGFEDRSTGYEFDYVVLGKKIQISPDGHFGDFKPLCQFFYVRNIPGFEDIDYVLNTLIFIHDNFILFKIIYTFYWKN